MRNFVCDVRLLQMLAFIQLIRGGGGRKVSITGYYFHILFTELLKKINFVDISLSNILKAYVKNFCF